MKNKERYVDEIMDIVTSSRLAVLAKTNKPCGCHQIACSDCLFGEILDKDCFEEAKKWLEEEYEPRVDWSRVEVDTKILVSLDGKNWLKRHFAKYENNVVYAWADGRDSWTTWSKDNVFKCDYAKLYEGEGNEKE